MLLMTMIVMLVMMMVLLEREVIELSLEAPYVATIGSLPSSALRCNENE